MTWKYNDEDFTEVPKDMEGFVYSQDVCYSKEMVKNRVCVLLAGQESEKMVFDHMKVIESTLKEMGYIDK